jgi:hypothetical protein
MARRWQYLTLDLANTPPRFDHLDALNAVGRDGWELVTIMTNGVAYLKRPHEPAVPGRAAIGDPAGREAW